MFCMVLGIIVTIALFVVLGFERKAEETRYGRRTWIWHVKFRQIFAIFGLLICLLGCIAKVPANSVGVIYSPFGGTKEKTLSEGFHTKNIFDKVYDISTEVQTETIEGLTTQTKDAQFLTSTLDVKYRVDNSNAYLVFKQYKTLKNMSKNLITPTTQRVLELITTQYNIIDILGEKRSEIYTALENDLRAEFAKYGVEFYSISITDMDAGEALEKAITDEAVAKKAVETAEQNLLKAETEAKQKSVLAKADQDAAKIQAETRLIQAEAEKQANELFNQSVTDSVLKKKWIEKWDGVMPTYYAGDDTGVMIGIG